MRKKSGPIAALAAATFALFPVSASAETLACAGSDITVDAGPEADAAALCAEVAAIRERLAACHLPQTAPLTVVVTDDVPVEHGRCLGVFNCDDSTIEILTPSRMSATIDPEGPYAAVAPEDLFRSILMHELAHAAIYEATLGQPRSYARDEYLAYALQIGSLPAETRAAFLAAAAAETPVDRARINGVILSFAPELFAARAWQYFSSPGRGCDEVPDILAGRISFGSAPF